MGNKRQRGPQRGPKKFVKKPKRSKAYWQNRPTTTVAPVPQDDTESDSASSDAEAIETDYDKLLTVFSAKKSYESDEENSEGEEDPDDGEDVEEDHSSVLDEENDDVEDEEVSDVDDSDIEKVKSGSDENVSDSDEDNVPAEPTVEDVVEESDDEKEGEEGVQDSKNKVSTDITGGPRDPFTARYELKIPDELMEVVKSRDSVTSTLKWKRLGRLAYFKPKWSPTSTTSKSLLALTDDNDDNTVTNPDVQAAQMNLIEKEIEVIDISDGLENCFVKLQLVKNARTANARNLISETDLPLTPFQQEMFSIFHSYRDLCFTERTHTNSEEIRFVYTLHALNHLLKTRTKIVNNNARINMIKEGKKKKEDDNLGNIRDQGLVRPKILIVVPFKESARKIVDLMIQLLFGKDLGKSTIMKKGKFDDEFGTEKDAVPGSGNKPDDFYRTFMGNIDDGFKVGIGVTKKALKLYSDFYSSDFLISSPLGLRMVLESDADFLSSIELLIMDQVDVFMMQNWDHVTFLLDKIHQRPAKSHGVDFSRVRLWALDEMSSFYRQTLLFSRTPIVELNAIFNRSCHNYLGKLCTTNPVKIGSISSVVLNDIPIVFHRAESSSVASSIDDRFNYFVQKVIPEYKKDMMFHTLIFVPSYFDYVRLRNWFNKSDLDFSEVCEYTKEKKIFKARDQFFHGEKHFLLYTERSHFYRRFTIKGVRHLIFYQLPQNPHFFPEICHFMQPAFLNRKGGSDGNMTCQVIYTKYDNQRLASVCSTSKAEFMMSAAKNVHLFMPGNS